MRHYTSPRLTFYGNVADLTKSKDLAGTDSFAGGQAQPGGCLTLNGTPIFCEASQDSVVSPPAP